MTKSLPAPCILVKGSVRLHALLRVRRRCVSAAAAAGLSGGCGRRLRRRGPGHQHRDAVGQGQPGVAARARPARPSTSIQGSRYQPVVSPAGSLSSQGTRRPGPAPVAGHGAEGRVAVHVHEDDQAVQRRAGPSPATPPSPGPARVKLAWCGPPAAGVQPVSASADRPWSRRPPARPAAEAVEGAGPAGGPACPGRRGSARPAAAAGARGVQAQGVRQQALGFVVRRPQVAVLVDEGAQQPGTAGHRQPGEDVGAGARR